jgi:hypothetical protein
MVFFVKLELEISCRVCGEEASNHCFKAAICWILHYELTERISAYCAAQKKSVSEQSRVPDLQLGSTTITRDNSGNTWRTTKVGNSYVTQGPNGQTQTTTKLGNSYITRDSSSGKTLTTAPLGNSYQTRSNTGATWSTSPLGNNFITRETNSGKDSKPALIVIPKAK